MLAPLAVLEMVKWPVVPDVALPVAATTEAVVALTAEAPKNQTAETKQAAIATFNCAPTSLSIPRALAASPDLTS
jgi:hypothetical protein